MSDYNNLLALFQRLEPLQKETELVAKGLDGAALNETRNAAHHLLIALCNSDKCNDEIRKAENHAKRAIYDCHEAMLLNELEKFKVFKEDYKSTVVTDIVPDFIDRCKQANSALDGITKIRKSDVENASDDVRKYSPDRNKLYEDIAPFLTIIRENNRHLELARPELNKIIQKENKDRRRFWIGAIVAIVAVLVGICAWIFPRSPT